MQSVEDNLAVIDIGKTSAKILCFDRGGNLINDTRLKPNWIVNNGISELDVDHYWNWIMDSLEVFYDEAGVRHTIVTAHGCTFALIRNEKLALPILDYENEPPTEINKEFDNIKPSFSETYTPRLPMGLNYAVHIFWRQKKFPEIFEECDSILSLPQYWGWKFTGKKVSEISYIGCHSYLWSPKRNEPSSLTKKKGWDKKSIRILLKLPQNVFFNCI